jgi:hypothetical protein
MIQRDRLWSSRLALFMKLSLLACALVVPVTGVNAASTAADGELTSHFATDSVWYEFEQTLGTYRLLPREQPGVRLTIHGLALDASSTSPTTCTLSPWNIHGTQELYIAWNATVPAHGGLLIEARPVPQRDVWRLELQRADAHENPWIVVGSIGRIPSEIATPRTATDPRMSAHEGWVRFERFEPYVQFRFRAFAGDEHCEPVLVERMCFAGSNRGLASMRPYPPPGGCSLGYQLMRDADREAHEVSHTPHSVTFVSLDARPVDAQDADSLERASAAACLRMLLANVPQVDEHVTRMPRVDSRSLPSQLASTAHECGARSRLECCSEHREAEALLASGKPIALRTIDDRNCLGWIVLSSFDEHDDALIYDPASYSAIPQRWTWAELERRWFGAGGLALVARL